MAKVSLHMEPAFIAATDMEGVHRAAATFAQSAELNSIYSMADVVREMYSVGYDSAEFRRVAPHVGFILGLFGFVRRVRKNRNVWIRTEKKVPGPGVFPAWAPKIKEN